MVAAYWKGLLGESYGRALPEFNVLVGANELKVKQRFHAVALSGAAGERGGILCCRTWCKIWSSSCRGGNAYKAQWRHQGVDAFDPLVCLAGIRGAKLQPVRGRLPV